MTLRFASPDLGVEETEAVAAPQGDGHYTVTGPFTTLVGKWQLRAIVRRAGNDDVTATFDLPIGAAPPPAPTATFAPAVTAMMVGYGAAALLIVAALLGGAATLSRRWSAHPPRRTATVNTPPPVNLPAED